MNARFATRVSRALSFGIALVLFSSVDSRGQTALVVWDIPTGTPNTALTSSVAPGVSATAITTSGLSVVSSSSAWRLDGWDAPSTTSSPPTDYLDFSISAGPGYAVTLQYLTFTAGATTGSAGSWTTPTLNLLYTTDSSWATGVQSAGSLVLSSGSIGASNSTAPTVSANTSTFFAQDLSLAASTTYYFRLVATGSGVATAGAVTNGARVIFPSSVATNEMQLFGTAIATAVPKNLVWNGSVSSTWNSSSANFTDQATSTSTTFGVLDSVTISSPTAITVDAAGVASSGSLTVNNASDTVSLSGGSVSFATGTKSGAGTLVLNSANTFSNGLTISGGVLESRANNATGTALLTLDGGTLRTTADVTSFSNTLRVGVGGGTVDIAGPLSVTGGVATTGADVGASNTLVKSGAGVLTISGGVGNSFSKTSSTAVPSGGGAVNLNITGGEMVFSGGATRNLGGNMTWDGNLTAQGGTISLYGSTVTGNGTLAITGSTTVEAKLNFGSASVSNPVAVSPSVTLSLSSGNGSNSLNFSGPISGSGTVALIGNGIVRLNSSTESSFSGTVLVEAGTANRTITTQALGSATALTLNGNASVQNTGSDSFGGTISGAGALLINTDTAAKLTLTAQSAHAGPVTVQEGGLILASGASLASPTVVVQSGGLIGGSGIFSGAVSTESGSAISPGESPGTLTLGSASIAGGTRINWEVNAATGTAGVNWDTIQVNGALSLTATAQAPITISLQSLTSGNQAGFVSGYANLTQYSYALMTATGGITGFSSDIFVFDATNFLNSGDPARWAARMEGNTVYADFLAPVPEPSTYALFAGVAGLGFAIWRRRVRQG